MMKKENCFKSLILSIFFHINTVYFYDIYRAKLSSTGAAGDQGYYIPAMHIMNLTYEFMPHVELAIVDDSKDGGCAFSLLQPDHLG